MGWAFKLSGFAFAGAALWAQRRKARRCAIEARPRPWRNAAVTALVAFATYATLYGVTTWLGRQAG